jgi:hypothetical protein
MRSKIEEARSSHAPGTIDLLAVDVGGTLPHCGDPPVLDDKVPDEVEARRGIQDMDVFVDPVRHG